MAPAELSCVIFLSGALRFWYARLDLCKEKGALVLELVPGDRGSGSFRFLALARAELFYELF